LIGVEEGNEEALGLEMLLDALFTFVLSDFAVVFLYLSGREASNPVVAAP
jgi:hypothetical protein